MKKELKCKSCRHILLKHPVYITNEQCIRCYTTDYNDYTKGISTRDNIFLRGIFIVVY